MLTTILTKTWMKRVLTKNRLKMRIQNLLNIWTNYAYDWSGVGSIWVSITDLSVGGFVDKWWSAASSDIKSNVVTAINKYNGKNLICVSNIECIYVWNCVLTEKFVLQMRKKITGGCQPAVGTNLKKSQMKKSWRYQKLTLSKLVLNRPQTWQVSSG